MSRLGFAACVVAILVGGAALRVAWLRADPPVRATAGIVWHDEGPWTHNARNRALWGVWRTDNWNPVFVAPVFTALEYAAFRTFGVGTWQARTVPVLSGLVAVCGLIIGLAATRGRRAAVVGGLLLSTSYVFVMWNRAALMESTMTACMAGAWAAYALGERRPWWGVAAGALAALAWFTKASAAFFIGAMVLDATWTVVGRRRLPATSIGSRRAALMTLAGLALTATVIAVVFVLPHWAEYRFYNWQMSVTRKPVYSIRAILDRASWLPLAQDVFTRSWIVLTTAMVGLLGILARWRTAPPAERLLVLWVALGLAELVVHDAGNARRYVMFLPPLAALAAVALTSDRSVLPPALVTAGRGAQIATVPVLMAITYLVLGSLARAPLAAVVDSGHFSGIVRTSATVAVALTGLILLRWTPVVSWCGRHVVPGVLAAAIAIAAVGWDVTEYSNWAAGRTEKNYQASLAVGRLLPDGTLVQGKLANGLSLENRIRPVFIGNGFGNYEDRLRRDDIRYLLTYEMPRIGYESSDGSGLIQGILDHYPNRRIVATFEVDETPDTDRAALIDKMPQLPLNAKP